MSEQEAESPEDDFLAQREGSRITDWAAGDCEFLQQLEAVLEGIDRDELTRFTRDLVRIPSVFCPGTSEGNEARVARHLAEYLDENGFDVRLEEVNRGRPNVWALWNGNRPGKTLLFERHTDVVTEGPAEA